MHFISRDAEGTSPQTPLSTCSQDQTHPWGRPTKVLQVSRQGAEGCPYLCHERAVPLWASPAALETTQSVEREMDARSHEGVNLWLPTTSTPLVTSDLIENPGEGWRVGPRGRVLQEVEKTEAYIWVCSCKAEGPTQERGLWYCYSRSGGPFVFWLAKT